MLTKLLKPMPMLIKLALLMVTLLGTPIPLPELHLKRQLLLAHTQTILSIEQDKDLFNE